jgi:hypothetical protein
MLQPYLFNQVPVPCTGTCRKDTRTVASRKLKSLVKDFFFLRARVCWPLLCLCRPFCIFVRCLDSNPESCHSEQVRYQLSHPSPYLPPISMYPMRYTSPLQYQCSTSNRNKVAVPVEKTLEKKHVV